MSGLSGLSSAVSWKSLTGSSVVWLCRAVGEIGKRGLSDGGGNGLIMVFTLVEAGSVEEVVEKESAKASAAIGFVKIAEFVS